MKINSYKVGVLAETIAKLFLLLKFYRIIDCRYKTKYAEIDLISYKNNTLIFIEVKYRKKISNVFHPIDIRQLDRIKKAAKQYLIKKPQFQNSLIRFDYIEIEFFKIKHILNAF